MSTSIVFFSPLLATDIMMPRPIKITRPDGALFVVIVSGPLEIDHPVDPLAHALENNPNGIEVIAVNELAVRGNLADATSEVLERVRG